MLLVFRLGDRNSTNLTTLEVLRAKLRKVEVLIPFGVRRSLKNILKEEVQSENQQVERRQTQ
jgi:hypothetical protein